VAASPSYAAARQGEGAQGSAVAVTPSLLLTNCHVVVGPVLVLIQGHTIVPASLVARDVTGDRCVLEPMEPVALKPVPVRGYADLRVGEKVYTIGSPNRALTKPRFSRAAPARS
jgi:serine protease Do